MKMNIPCKVLKMVKRYAMTTDDSLRKNRPNDHVSPSRQSSANAPNTQDLRRTSTNHSGWNDFTTQIQCMKNAPLLRAHKNEPQ